MIIESFIHFCDIQHAWMNDAWLLHTVTSFKLRTVQYVVRNVY